MNLFYVLVMIFVFLMVLIMVIVFVILMIYWQKKTTNIYGYSRVDSHA